MIEADANRMPEPTGPPPMPGTGQPESGAAPTTSGVGLPPRPQMQPRRRVATPVWRRVTALFSLSFMSVVVGFVLAAALAITALLVLVVLERAIAT